MKIITRKNVIFGLILLSVALVLWLAVSIEIYKRDNAPDYLQKIYSNQNISDAGDKHYKIGSKDLYTARISIGGTVLYQIFEKWVELDDEGKEWTNGKYRYFTTEEEPKLLKEVGVFTPPQDANEALNTNFLLQDITGDDVEELFMRVLSSGSNLSEWEILKLDGDTLVNITIQGQKENPTWVTFDKVGNRGGYVWLEWHSSDMRGRNLYKLDGNELILERTVRIKFVDGADDCDVSVKDGDDTDFTFVERTACENIPRDGSLNFDRYYFLIPEQILFLSQLYNAKSDPKLSVLAEAYSDNCEAIINTAILAGVRDFNGLLQSGQVHETSDGEVRILPCGRGAYQDWELPVFYDGNTYTPLTLTHIDSAGKRTEQSTAVSLGYNKETDTFSYHGGGNGVHSCWEEGEYKLVGRKLVLQKFTADFDCEDADGKQDEGEVIFDITDSE